MTQNRNRLYDLLPRVIRRIDLERDQSLYALVKVFDNLYQILEDNITDLYDDWFIETCRPWCIPYIADQVGIDDLKVNGGFPGGWRALVANTVGYGRRKGTVATIAAGLRDAAGWGTTAVEFYRLISVTQELTRLCPQRGKTVDLRDAAALENLDSPFETISHTVDLRGFSPSYIGGHSSLIEARGKYDIPNIGVFLWRLRSYPREEGAAFAAGSGRFTFNPCGLDAPLFHQPRAHTDNKRLPGPQNLPVRLTPELLKSQLREAARDRSYPRPLRIFTREKSENFYREINPADIFVTDLAQWTSPGDQYRQSLPQSSSPGAYIDPRLGRLVLSKSDGIESVRVTYSYGFSGDLGGGPYERDLPTLDPDLDYRTVRVSGIFALGKDPTRPQPHEFSSLAAALATPREEPAPTKGGPLEITRDTFCLILDNDTYSTTNGKLQVKLTDRRTLVVTAARGKNPRIAADLELAADAPCKVVINGILLDGSIKIKGPISLHLRHTTLLPRPKKPSITAPDAANQTRVIVHKCIIGPVYLPPNSHFKAEDSIVDGVLGPALAASGQGQATTPDYGPSAELERCTILGAASLTRLDGATDVLFNKPTQVKETNSGFVRCSYLPAGSITPQQSHCIHPAPGDMENFYFTSTRYGDPGYGQLDTTCPQKIQTGAGNGAELGAFNFLLGPRRKECLRQTMEKYIPYGLKEGVFYVS